MVIGIDASRANTTQQTGVESYAFHIIQELKQTIPSHVHVVLYSREKLQGTLADLPEHWESKVLHWPPKRLWTQIRLSLEMIFARPDILFIPAHVFPLIHPKKTVMMVHDVAARAFPKSYNWFERWYSLWSAKVAVKRLWKVIVPSQFTKSELEACANHMNSQITIVPHGYQISYSNKDVQETREVLEKYNITKPFLLSIGRLEEKKNTKRMLQAFEIVRSKVGDNLQFVLVGKPGHGYQDVLDCIQSHRYKDDIIHPGWVEQQDVIPLLCEASAFVFPSLYEGFGLPILEAFACETPVIASKGNSLQEVGGGAAEYVDALDIDDIAQAILRVFEDQSKRLAMIEKGTARLQHFSWKTSGEQTAAILLG